MHYGIGEGDVSIVIRDHSGTLDTVTVTLDEAG